MKTPDTKQAHDLYDHFRAGLEMVENMPDANPEEFLAKHRKMQLLGDEVKRCKEAIICELVNKYPCSEICEVVKIATEKTDILIELIKLAKASLRQVSGRAPEAKVAAKQPPGVTTEFEPQSPRISEASTACPSSCEPQWPRTSGATQTETLQRASGTLRAARDAWHPHGSGCDTQIAVFPGDMLGVEWRQSPEEGGFWAWGLNIKQQTFGYFPIACLDI
jgi:hypothetical protein